MFFLCLHGENSVITRVSSRLLSHEVAFLIIGESQNVEMQETQLEDKWWIILLLFGKWWHVWNNVKNIQNKCFSLYFFFCFQGANASALEKEIGPEQFPVNEHYFGLVNVSVSRVTLYRQKHHRPHALSLLFFHSSATLATVTRCCRLCTSVDRSGRRCWRTRWVTRENYSDCVQELDCRVCEWATDERRISCTWKYVWSSRDVEFPAFSSDSGEETSAVGSHWLQYKRHIAAID